MGLFTIFGTSLRALNAYSGALGIVANNIANSSNENYSRQVVEFASLSPDKTGGIETGRGVVLNSVTQIVDRFVEKRLTEGVQTSGQYTAKSTYMSNIESLFNEVGGGGLNSMIGKFFDTFTALSAEPDSTSVRNSVLNAASNVIDRFHDYGTSIDNLRQSVDLEINSIVPSINSKLQQISELNQKIQESSTDPLTFKDERRKLINDLGQYIDINVVEGDDDQLQIYTKAGNPLINGVSVATLSTATNITNDNLQDIYSSMGDTETNITNTIQDGRLKGLIDVRDNNLADYKDQLDDLAYTFINEVNDAHDDGFDLDGNTGNLFFTALGSSAAASTAITLSSDVDGNPDGIAASGALIEIPGGNDIALAIADLGDSTSIAFSASTSSFTGFYSDFLATIGNDSALSQSNQTFQDSVVLQIKLDRSQTSSVNVDEEQVNLVKFQAAYQASGKLVQVADQMLQTLMSALGV